jgi:hypothetical protein
MAKKNVFDIAKPRLRSQKHIDEDAKQTIADAKKRAIEYADVGDEDAYIKQLKAVFPGISGPELLEKIALFRELKELRRTRGGS